MTMKHATVFSRLVPPKEVRLPLAACVLLNLAVYYGGRLLTAGRFHTSLALAADARVPFVPAMVAVYLLSFPFWVIGFLTVAQEDRRVVFPFLAGEQIAKLLCFACFLVLPTTLTRPAVSGGGAAAWVLRLIYRLDSPDMLFPSLHCLESWFCFRGALLCRRRGRGYRIFCLTGALLIFASTVMIRQHVLLDVAGGIAAAELGLLLSRLTRAGRLWDKAASFVKT